MSNILLKNIHYLITNDKTCNIQKNIDIKITGNLIKKISSDIENVEDIDGYRVINCEKFAVMPGFVNTHHHFYQAMFRCIEDVQEKPLFPWLIDLYEYWKYLDEETVYFGAKIAMSELIKTGCTLTSDHHYLFPNTAGENLIDAQIKAAKELGIRFHATRGSMSRGKSSGGLPPDSVIQTEDMILSDSERLINRYHDESFGSMCRIALAPCSPFSVSKNLMRESAALARKFSKVHLHTHLAETKDEEAYCKSIYNCRPAELMAEVNWTGSDVWFAHGIYLSDEDIKLLDGAGISHCPTSNMKLNSGICRVSELFKRNIPISIAVDGSASNDGSNMWEEVRRAFLLNHLKYGTESLTAQEMLYVSSKGGADVLGRDDLGIIKEGMLADIILVDINKISYSGCHDIAYSLMTCGNTSLVDYNIINGEVIVDNGILVNCDENQLFNDANAKAKNIFRKHI